jgi:hypothetical protein
MAHTREQVEIEPYTLSDPPVGLDQEIVEYLYEELRRLQMTIEHLTEAAPQATDKVPDSPRAGTIRWNVQPWDPLTDGLEGFVQYNGSAWAALSARA